jgi:G3E family GTPase
MLRFVPLGGYLGAGKTTTMLAVARRMEAAGERVGVITNDQGVDLVDTALARDRVALAGEVTGGCFCCRFEDLTATVLAMRAEHDPTVILAEAVGSCTDLQSTVVRPLRAYHGQQVAVAPLTAVVDPQRYAAFVPQWDAGPESDLAYLYRHQLDEADIIALNKIDLLDDVAPVLAELAGRFPHALVAPISAHRGSGLDELIRQWWAEPRAERRVPVDYHRYGTAESELSWTNLVLELDAGDEGFAPRDWVGNFLRSLAGACRSRGVSVGHLKAAARHGGSVTKASVANDSGAVSFDEQRDDVAGGAVLTVNARVQCEPRTLEALVQEAVAAASEQAGVSARRTRRDVFRPGWPEPVHRM